eukprot:gene45445-60713_t
MATVVERISAAKKQVEGLKSQLDKAREQKMDGYPGIAKHAAGKSVSALGSLPKVRRVLKGHFGKVYAMNWAGDSTHL